MSVLSKNNRSTKFQSFSSLFDEKDLSYFIKINLVTHIVRLISTLHFSPSATIVFQILVEWYRNSSLKNNERQFVTDCQCDGDETSPLKLKLFFIWNVSVSAEWASGIEKEKHLLQKHARQRYLARHIMIVILNVGEKGDESDKSQLNKSLSYYPKYFLYYKSLAKKKKRLILVLSWSRWDFWHCSSLGRYHSIFFSRTANEKSSESAVSVNSVTIIISQNCISFSPAAIEIRTVLHFHLMKLAWKCMIVSFMNRS